MVETGLRLIDLRSTGKGGNKPGRSQDFEVSIVIEAQQQLPAKLPNQHIIQSNYTLSPF